MRGLVVILGAGASHDCVGPRFSGSDREPAHLWKPPLTRELFEQRQTFGPILDQYPGARAASADIRLRIAPSSDPDDAFVLEKYLREELKDSVNPDARFRFRQIPLYLQHLLFEVSRKYTTDPANYSRLVNAALGSNLDNVVFVTLNYDTILDRELFFRTPAGAATGDPASIDDYVSDDRPWALVKLHGSVNWVRRVLRGHRPHHMPGPAYLGYFEAFADAIEAGELDSEIQLRVFDDIAYMRWSDKANALFYPALSVPIGPDPELLNCPEEHVTALHARLERMGGDMNVLVIGYSGLDVEVMDLLKKGGSIRTLMIVDRDPETIHKRFEERFGTLEARYSTGFTLWAYSAEITSYFDELCRVN